ncbi:hypothetical protein IQ260_28880 [Leptolyngbya cf. ectocarpi LEGE 11479]|uniref:S-layer family protein n=1 Tax=Leptolyngbya cf. ectocarpi LEGE 11479 TaxID=1828722 RepID=A0A929A071_LEPEC|nr:hypothetical protein [Leptolyngbya ectocarpi]MBE9070660.1 hypothetical protein [Leptolyngbya cf. ectocarpi LEGE 11479]
MGSGSNESGNGGAITVSADGDIDIASTLRSSSSSNSSLDESGDGGSIALVSNFGDIEIANLSERFVDNSLISSFSYSVAGAAGNGGSTSVRAPKGSITGDGGRILTAAIAEASGVTDTGGNIYLEASSTISGLEILTLAGSGNSGDVNVQGRSESLTIDNLRLITSGRIEIADPNPTINQAPETITLNIDNLGQPGNTLIQNTGDIILNNVNIEASANGSQPAGGVTVTSPGQVTFTNSQITSNANSTGDAGTIRLDVGQLNLGNGGRIFAATSDSGNGGNVIINATDSVFLGEGVQDFEPVISVLTFPTKCSNP